MRPSGALWQRFRHPLPLERCALLTGGASRAFCANRRPSETLRISHITVDGVATFNKLPKPPFDCATPGQRPNRHHALNKAIGTGVFLTAEEKQNGTRRGGGF